MLNRLYVYIICLVVSTSLISSCSKDKTETSTLFCEVPIKSSGLNFRNDLVPTEDLNIITYLYFYNGGGIAAGDINSDGLIDLYFTANQGPDALFLNEGGLVFRNVTTESGLSVSNDWSSGASFADVDSDGDLDLYVNKVSNVAGLTGRNELYINDGSGVFIERASDFGLDFSGLSTQMAFTDFDGDGDLDAYLLNHSVHDTERRLDTSMRNVVSSISGDRLYLQNESGYYVDVTSNSGISQSRIGYGLGLAVADLNGDFAPDIYVSNDFSENDYLYINTGGGQFKESIADFFAFTSKFSMGNVVADVNSDGELDLLTLDMRPASDSIRKSNSSGSDPRQFTRQRELGFLEQQSRNVLHLSVGANSSENAISYGIHSSDWSWSPIVADFNLDGQQDIFIANGIWQRPNNLDYLKYTSAKAIQNNVSNLTLASLMPPGLVRNHLYLGNDQLPLTDVAVESGLGLLGSTTAALAIDLDNDGDLDLVTNNVNAPAGIFENTTVKTDSRNVVLKISLVGPPNNHFAIGSNIRLRTDAGWERVIAVQPVSGFQSSSITDKLVAFPRNTSDIYVSVDWPDGKRSKNYLVEDFEVTVSYADAIVDESEDSQISTTHASKNVRPQSVTAFFDNNPLFPIYYLEDSARLAGVLPLEHSSLDISLEDDELYFLDTVISNVSAIALMSNEDFQASHESRVRQSRKAKKPRILVAQRLNDASSKLFIISTDSVGSSFIESHSCLNRRFSKIASIRKIGSDYLIQPAFDSHFSECYVLNESLASADLNQYVGASYQSRLYNYELNTQDIVPHHTQLTDVFEDADTFYIARLWAPIEKRWFDSEASELMQEFLTPTGLWTSICLIDSSLIEFNNVGYNNLLVENPNQYLEFFLADYDRNGEVDPIAVRVEQGVRKTMFGLDEIADQMPTMRKFFTSYLPFSSSTFDEMFPVKMNNRIVSYEAASLESMVYDKRSNTVISNILTPKTKRLSTSCSGRGRLYVNPVLRSDEN